MQRKEYAFDAMRCGEDTLTLFVRKEHAVDLVKIIHELLSDDLTEGSIKFEGYLFTKEDYDAMW